MPILTLTTDFGTRDWFVGVMKGVILRLNPQAVVVDLTHGIAAGDIRGAAFALAAAYRFFPRATIHVVVVDPGVGSERRAVVVQTPDYFFVAPDNGVLSLVLEEQRIVSAHWLQNQKYFLSPVSQTFHGRDVFAPVAAHLSRGVPVSRLGPKAKSLVQLHWPKPRRRKGRLEGEVVYLDRFGNAITNLKPGAGSSSYEVRGRRRTTCPFKPYYESVPSGKPVAVPGSSGFIEIAVNGGSAQKALGLKLGARVTSNQ